MEEVYKEVYVKEEYVPDKIEIEPEYVYMTIPADYVCLYHKLLVYLSDFGVDLIRDCQSSCAAKNKTIIDCWNMFQAAIACHNLGQEDKANLFIKYIEAQLELYYKGTDEIVYNGGNIFPITPDGHLKAEVSCSNNSKFYVDAETGNLYQEYLDEQASGKVFVIDEDDLTVESNSKL